MMIIDDPLIFLEMTFCFFILFNHQAWLSCGWMRARLC